MSDYMTNVEIDDVLSSIRRLVSEEKPKKPAAVPDNDRFVLTPALRVMDEAVSTVAGRDGRPARAASDMSAPLELKQYLATPAPAANMPAAQMPAANIPPKPAERPVSPEYQAMEQAWHSELARVSAQRPAQESAQQSAQESAPSEVASDAAPGTVPAQATSLESRIAELEAAVSMAGEEWEPDGSEPGFGQPPRHHIFEVVDNSAPPDEHAHDDSDADGSASEPADEPIQHTEKTSEMPFFSHAAAAPEMADSGQAPVAPNPVAPTPAPAIQDPATPPVHTPDDVVVPDVDGAPDLAPGRDHDPIPFPAPGDVVEDDDVFLDVEALREMISDVVRAELQGKMGETITRNVRRMVQQEIERALTHSPADPD
jgi:hypothetical protein